MEKSKFIKNLKTAFGRIGYNTGHGFIKQLSEKYGVSAPAANDWLNDKKSSYPRLEILGRMSEDTGVTINHLLFGNLEKETLQYKVPVYLLDYITELDLSLSVTDRTIQPKDWVSFMDGYNPHLFAIEQVGESMQSATGFSFPEKTIVVFNADKKNPPNGGLVLAQVNNNQVVFRRYITEGIPYLKPLNPTYENYSGEFSIIATFEYAIIKS
ncbi:MAG: hypothetical protein KGV46_02660 [Pasteurella sp.]|nr:hypothetical protein [Pasteurella sp.]